MDEYKIEELCDILEVVYAIAKTKGYSDSDLNIVRENKKLKNGGFDKKLFLEKVVNEND
jgi:predicted house-cleaning noncanonical NTP pyrophosphatase (MazG superfamily)